MSFHSAGHARSARWCAYDDIARIYHVSKAEIIAANRLSAPYSLEPGTMLPIGIAVPPVAEKPKPKLSPHAKAAHRPSRTAGDEKSAGSRKPKQSGPKVIPLD